MTGLLFESVRVKLGAFCPTWGAAADAGSHRPATKTTKRRPARSNTPSAAAKELKIFAKIRLSGLKARRRPRYKSTIAIANRIRLTQGKSRVTGHRTNTNRKLNPAPTL